MQQKTAPILVGLLVIASFLLGSMWTKIQYLEGRAGSAPSVGSSPTGNTAQQQQAAPSKESSLSITNLKAYARELGLDVNKFDSCLDSKKYTKRVEEDRDYGSSIGVSGTPAFFINGKFLSGAQPLENFKEVIDKELNGTGSSDITVYSSNLQNIAKQQGFNPKPIEVKLKDNDPMKGEKNAKVTLVEFSDFECPWCARVFSTVKTLVETYKGEMRFVYKQWPFPPQSHPNAQLAAEASLCANEQGKFWEYHDKLFTVQQG